MTGTEMRFERLARESLSSLDRRSFLRLTGAVAAAGLLPTGCSEPSRYAPPVDALPRLLTPRTYAVLGAAAERIVGGRGGNAIRAGEIRPGARADAFLASSPDLAPRLNQALLVLEFGVMPLVAKLRPFTSLSGSARDGVLADLMESRIDLKRAVFQGVKAVSLLTWYGSPFCQPVEQVPGVNPATIRDAMQPPDDFRNPTHGRPG